MQISEILSNRRNEIKAQIKELRAELGKVDALLKQLRSMEEEDQIPPTEASKTERRGTIKDLALEVLRANPEGLDTNHVIAEIKRTHGQHIARPSMSPQLSRLKAVGEIEQFGNVWKIVTHKEANNINLLEGDAFDNL